MIEGLTLSLLIPFKRSIGAFALLNLGIDPLVSDAILYLELLDAY